VNYGEKILLTKKPLGRGTERESLFFWGKDKERESRFGVNQRSEVECGAFPSVAKKSRRRKKRGGSSTNGGGKKFDGGLGSRISK